VHQLLPLSLCSFALQALQLGAQLPLAPYAKAQWLVESGNSAAAVHWFATAIDTNDAMQRNGGDP
jgi:hypothetical protein